MENRFKVTPIIINLTSLNCNKNSRVGEEGVELQRVCWEMCLKLGTSTRACPIYEHQPLCSLQQGNLVSHLFRPINLQCGVHVQNNEQDESVGQKNIATYVDVYFDLMLLNLSLVCV